MKKDGLPWLPLTQPSEAIEHAVAYLTGWLEMRVLVFLTGVQFWTPQLPYLQLTRGRSTDISKPVSLRQHPQHTIDTP